MIKIICVGKIKEQYFRDAIEEYSKRLKKYTSLEIVELEDIGLDDSSVVIKKEKEKILKVLDTKDYIISLDINGVELDSIELSKKIDNILIQIVILLLLLVVLMV